MSRVADQIKDFEHCRYEAVQLKLDGEQSGIEAIWSIQQLVGSQALMKFHSDTSFSISEVGVGPYADATLPSFESAESEFMRGPATMLIGAVNDAGEVSLLNTPPDGTGFIAKWHEIYFVNIGEDNDD